MDDVKVEYDKKDGDCVDFFKDSIVDIKAIEKYVTAVMA